jgi:hypothetical protein
MKAGRRANVENLILFLHFNINLMLKYKKIKLDMKDKFTSDNIKIIRNEMKQLDGPGGFRTTWNPNRTNRKSIRFHDDRIGSVNQRARGDTIGKYKRRHGSYQVENKTMNPKFKRLYFSLCSLYKKYVKRKPGAIRVNCNIKSKKHVDSKNVGTSVILGIGNYTGGCLILHPSSSQKCKKKYINIKNAFVIFDSTSIIHSTDKFTGKRYSFVYFNN